MEILVLVVGLMLSAVLLVGVGDRLKLPWPVLMLPLGVAVAFIPGLPDNFDLEPELILPLFLPPLLFAAAQRTSWALFRARWRSIAFLAVGLVVTTVAAVSGAVVLLVPGIGISAAIALGAMVAPPDPVAVEAVAGPVRMPRRLLAVLQSEGLFNDATALVIFQTAVLATVRGGAVSAPTLVLRFLLGVAGAVLLGLVVARAARWITARVTDTTGRSALTLVLPFAVYLAADEIGASGVVAVVVLTWCGMRGLATLALALSLPATTDAGAGFPQRAEIVLIAASVLVVTLVVPGFTLPALVRMLGVAADADAEHAVEQAIVARARAAAMAALAADDRVGSLPEGVGANLRQRMDRLDGVLRGEPASAEDREQAEKVRRHREIASRAQSEALAAARAEVLAARREPGVDPEAADRVLRRLDLRTVLLD